jgi:hypothetical protein
VEQFLCQRVLANEHRDWVQQIAAAHKRYGHKKTEREAKLKYLAMVSQSPLYACTKIFAHYRGVWPYGIETVIAVNYDGIKFISVQEKQRLFKAMDRATEIYHEMRRRINTKQLNDFFLPLMRENSPPAVKGKEIKINYITQIKSNPPLIAFFGNHPELVPESYRRFLENRLREQFGFEGVPINILFKKK